MILWSNLLLILFNLAANYNGQQQQHGDNGQTIAIIGSSRVVDTESSSAIDNSDLKDDLQKAETPPPTIAIIGGGIGGTSSAYFLRELFTAAAATTADSQPSSLSDIAAVMDLYERNGELGGRLRTQLINGRYYETGGTMIHERNRYARQLAAKFGLSRRDVDKHFDTKLCLFNGKSFDFCESSLSLWTYLKIWYRYGFDVHKLESKVSKIMDYFDNIYSLQEDHNIQFDTVDQLLTAMNPLIKNLTKITYKDYLTNARLSKTFIDELVQSIALVNYGQDVSIPAFVGSVSFAGAGANLWSIKGGNKLLAKNLAKHSAANIHLNTRVDSVTQLAPNMFDVTVTDTVTGQSTTRRYNSVIIATPLTENQIRFNNFTDDNINLKNHINGKQRRYHRTVATLVAGKLLKKFNGKDILCDNKSTFFTSIGRLSPVDDDDNDQSISAAAAEEEKTPVYKVFSPTPLTTEQLSMIFSDIQSVHITDWYAYPEYDTVTEPLPSFLLSSSSSAGGGSGGGGVYHLNAIEWAASAIEMSLIGGKNVALLAYNQFGGKTNVFNIDNKTLNNNNNRRLVVDEL
ncbi:prenylcysteine oxidase 1-like [Oppia nitens]|uniref:prenylcysteine oxidase 1-like n=1 Tax=Oppia nitens TaxID=1686743 RepID=UPI0023DBF109|nr:prenylcysteine oxidase 1-like [Oppia nitens]